MIRSRVRVVIWPLLGLVAAAGMAVDGDPFETAFGVLFFVTTAVWAWWPRLAVGPAGVEVRNFRTRRIGWEQVTGLAIEDQGPYFSRLARAYDRWNYRYGPYPGLVVRTPTGTVPVIALQGASWSRKLPWRRGTYQPGWLAGAGAAIQSYRPDLSIRHRNRWTQAIR